MHHPDMTSEVDHTVVDTEVIDDDDGSIADFDNLLPSVKEGFDSDNPSNLLMARADSCLEYYLKSAGLIRLEDYMYEIVKGSGIIKIRTIRDLFNFADPLLWWRAVGRERFPSVAILARIYLNQHITGSFQESIFCSSENAMNSYQTSMTDGLFEQRTVLLIS